MDQLKKPSEKIIVNNPYDGKILTDARGRKIRLKQADILDEFDLMGALGTESSNPIYYMYAQIVLHIATIDDQVMEAPKTKGEFRAAIKRIDRDGMEAYNKFLLSLEETSQTELDRVKK
jgi:hypothetical protein